MNQNQPYDGLTVLILLLTPLPLRSSDAREKTLSNATAKKKIWLISLTGSALTQTKNFKTCLLWPRLGSWSFHGGQFGHWLLLLRHGHELCCESGCAGAGVPLKKNATFKSLIFTKHQVFGIQQMGHKNKPNLLVLGRCCHGTLRLRIRPGRKRLARASKLARSSHQYLLCQNSAHCRLVIGAKAAIAQENGCDDGLSFKQHFE